MSRLVDEQVQLLNRGGYLSQYSKEENHEAG